MRFFAWILASMLLGPVFDVPGADEFYGAAVSNPAPMREVTVENRQKDWPGLKDADRLLVEIENLDGGGDVLTLEFFGKKWVKKELQAATAKYLAYLPQQGRDFVIVPLCRIYDKIDRRQIERIVFSVEGGAARRFAVRRMAFLKVGEDNPKSNADVRRDERNEAEHRSSLATFRRTCGGGGLVVGQASSMEAVRPRAGFSVRPADSLALRLARNEYESVQIVVASEAGDLKDVRIVCSDLKSPSGSFSARNMKCSPVGFVEVTYPPPYVVRPGGKRPSRGWWPDAILDFTDRADVVDGDVQPFWLRVRCPETQRAGIYRGAVLVRARTAKGTVSRRIPLSVRVNGFSLPKKSMLPLAVSFWPSPGGVSACDGREDVVQRRREDSNGIHNAWKTREWEYGRFLADYLLTWDNLYLNPQREARYDILKRLKDEGRLGMFNLSYWWFFTDKEGSEEHWRTNSLPRLRARYERAKSLGIAEQAYLYGCDEVNPWAFTNIARTVRRLHKEFPGVKVMTTARDRQLGVDGSPLGEMDIFCPATCHWNPSQVEKSRAAGHQVWWYFCNVPSYPLANTMVETPPIEIRNFMGAQTVKFKPDGFLYYATASWNGERPIMTPYYDWSARSFGIWNGDGQWTCCGGPDKLPLPTLRLENFRDGLEDYAYAKILERKLLGCPDRNCTWAKRAKDALEVPLGLVRTLEDFSIDPVALYAWRNRLADCIEE